MFTLSTQFAFIFLCCDSLCKLCFPLFSAVKKLKIKIWLTSSLWTRHIFHIINSPMTSSYFSQSFYHFHFFLISFSPYLYINEWYDIYLYLHTHMYVMAYRVCVYKPSKYLWNKNVYKKSFNIYLQSLIAEKFAKYRRVGKKIKNPIMQPLRAKTIYIIWCVSL